MTSWLMTKQVAVTTAQQRVEPGQEVLLHVQARPGSSVGILVEENNGASAQVVTLQSVRRQAWVTVEGSEQAATHPSSFSQLERHK